MMMNVNPVLYVILGIAGSSTAQIFLKSGSSFDILSKKWIVFLFLSMLTYGISFLCFYLALRFYEITKIGPIMMVGTVSIIAVYGFIVGENISLSKIVGILLALLSIVLLSKS
jgi:drug/metabolite transporter (DMT)-like permease